MAGQRAGLAGDRGGLWWQFHRLISEGRPRWVVGENVPGLLSSRGGQDFATIIDSLTELGYRVAWRVLDAQYFGVAQRRRRVFIVGHLGDKSPSEVLAIAEGMSGHPKPRREAGQEVAERATGGTRVGSIADDGAVRALTSRFGGTGADLTDAEGGYVVPVSGPLGAGENGPRFDLDSQGAYIPYELPDVHPPPMARSSKSPNVEGGEDIVIPFAQNTRDEVRIIDEANGAQIAGALAADAGMKQQTYLMRQREGKPGGGKGPLLPEDKSLTLAANTNDQVLFVNGRQDPTVHEGVSQPLDTAQSTGVVAYDELNDTVADTHHTLGAGTKQSTGVVSGMQVRRLTPLECERLQGFPDGWTDTQSDTQRYRQMGNAVAVPVVTWIMKRIAEVDSA